MASLRARACEANVIIGSFVPAARSVAELAERPPAFTGQNNMRRRQIVERWLIGRLRDRRFYSLAELNAAIGELLKRLNEERDRKSVG